jgi:thiamine kinase-like enzyme
VRELDERIERAAGSRPVRYDARSGGYSTADRFAVALADGRSVFVKSAEAPHMAAWLRREHEVYESLAGSFMPRLEGWDDDGIRPVLVIEDLSDADWAPRWDDARVQAVRDALAELAACEPPPNTESIRVVHPSLFGRWETVAADPAPFLSLALRDEAWLERSLPALMDAAAAAPVDGTASVHLDVRSDNMCFVGDRAVFVDWNWLSLGSPDTDLAGWAASLRLEGGPQPWELLPQSPEFASLLAGIFAAVAGLPPPETAPTVRAFQRAQLEVALEWFEREL